MTKKITAVTLAFSLATPLAYASGCRVASGTTYCGQGTISVLVAEGPAQINGTHILGNSLIEGKLAAQEASFNTIQVQGKTNITSSIVSGAAMLQGSLNNINQTFRQSLPCKVI